MASLARTGHGDARADGRPRLVVAAQHDGAARLESAHRTLLSDAETRVQPYLKAAQRVAAAAYVGAGATDAGRIRLERSAPRIDGPRRMPAITSPMTGG